MEEEVLKDAIGREKSYQIPAWYVTTRGRMVYVSGTRHSRHSGLPVLLYTVIGIEMCSPQDLPLHDIKRKATIEDMRSLHNLLKEKVKQLELIGDTYRNNSHIIETIVSYTAYMFI